MEPLKLKKILDGLQVQIKGKDVEVLGLTQDSRTAAPGCLFVAKQGQHAEAAVQGGAVAVVTDLYDPFLKVTQVIHPRPQELEAVLASRFFGAPDRELTLVGVTGTKGKTTTSYLLRQLLPQAGLLSTVEIAFGERRLTSTLTTHDRITNERMLREMVRAGCKSAVLEVSSHGLHQGRVAGLALDAAVFTNLYADHLDYHGTMEAYAEAKRGLFQMLDRSPKEGKVALINGADPWAPRVVQGIKTSVLRFGWGSEFDFCGSELELSLKGTRFRVNGQLVELPLLGRPNATNALAAAALALARGLPLEPLRNLAPIPGRLERVPDAKRHIFVDFAHAGAPLAETLATLRSVMQGGRLIVVFGCGGNRDPARRVGMAQAAEAGADLSIVTTDNPRTEDPETIAEAILAAYRVRPRYIPNREEAIAEALRLAQPGDTVLIAGKGHEQGQICAGQTIPFDDRKIAAKYVKF